jgi:hypothetical protein
MPRRSPGDHIHYYTARLAWSEWMSAGSLEERLGRRVPICMECGRERPSRRPRPAVLREIRAGAPGPEPAPEPAGREVAAALAARREEEVPVRGLFGRLGRRGVPAAEAEAWLDRFLRAGWVAHVGRVGRGDEPLVRVRLLDREALAAFAGEGGPPELNGALAEARRRVAVLRHPRAREIAGLLESPEAQIFPPALAAALAALAVHAESGEELPAFDLPDRTPGRRADIEAFRDRLERLVEAIRRNLAESPDAPLTATLRAVLEAGR